MDGLSCTPRAAACTRVVRDGPSGAGPKIVDAGSRPAIISLRDTLAFVGNGGRLAGAFARGRSGLRLGYGSGAWSDFGVLPVGDCRRDLDEVLAKQDAPCNRGGLPPRVCDRAGGVVLALPRS